MFDLWPKSVRRQKLFAQPRPEEWARTLNQQLWLWSALTAEQQHRLLGLVAIFLHEKEVVVPAEIHQADAARLTVAAAACQMLLGFDDLYCFDRVQTVILTLRPFRQQIHHGDGIGLVGELTASGVYTKGAPIALSWRDVQLECADPAFGHNVVVHEFAHHVDDLDGALDGAPPFASRQLAHRWREVADRESRRLEQQTAAGQPTVLDPYGLSNPAEFFAVSCEAYFSQPHALAVSHPELFQLLRELFRLDPRPWFAR
ncbi:MAG: M90 family metallopeptidase [Pirellulales bacterium]